MTDGPEWFAPKRYGYGAGLPISWQGWAVTLAFIALVGGLAFFFGDQPVIVIALLVPLSLLLILITARTTRGGWRWRWGEKD
ncbi:MAG TPA: hypothetical protein VJT70_02950 [Sphingomicrobium sp.]|nr:hypothetical protein [Sphingomicrobium sp.]